MAGGLPLGGLAAMALARLFRNQLYGVQPFDAPTQVLTIVAIAAVALLAAAWPPREARPDRSWRR